MSIERTVTETYQFDELVPCVEELLLHLRECSGDIEQFSASFIENNTWVSKYLCKTNRVKNLHNLISSDGLRVELVNGTPADLSKVAHKTIRIRVSLVNIRHRHDVCSEVFTFQEVFTNRFVYIDL